MRPAVYKIWLPHHATAPGEASPCGPPLDPATPAPPPPKEASPRVVAASTTHRRTCAPRAREKVTWEEREAGGGPASAREIRAGGERERPPPAPCSLREGERESHESQCIYT